jgi:putative sterol carrier protein
MAPKQAPVLFKQLEANLSGPDGEDLVKKIKGLVVFKIDGDDFTLDLRVAEEGSAGGDGKRSRVRAGAPDAGDSADLTLTLSDADFVKLVAGKLNPQQAFLTRRLKIAGAMSLAMKLQPILDAAGKPGQSKL